MNDPLSAPLSALASAPGFSLNDICRARQVPVIAQAAVHEANGDRPDGIPKPHSSIRYALDPSTVCAECRQQNRLGIQLAQLACMSGLFEQDL